MANLSQKHFITFRQCKNHESITHVRVFPTHDIAKFFIWHPIDILESEHGRGPCGIWACKPNLPGTSLVWATYRIWLGLDMDLSWARLGKPRLPSQTHTDHAWGPYGICFYLSNGGTAITSIFYLTHPYNVPSPIPHGPHLGNHGPNWPWAIWCDQGLCMGPGPIRELDPMVPMISCTIPAYDQGGARYLGLGVKNAQHPTFKIYPDTRHPTVIILPSWHMTL